MPWGFVAGAALSVLGSYLSSRGSNSEEYKITYTPVRLRTKDGTIVTMYRPSGQVKSRGGSSDAGTALQSVGASTMAYSTAAQKIADPTKPTTATQKNAAANSGLSDIGSGMEAMNKDLRLKSDVYRGVDKDEFFSNPGVDVDPFLNTRDPFSLRY